MPKRPRSPSSNVSETSRPAPTLSQTGILTVVLHEGSGLTVPDGFEERLQASDRTGPMPYALLDCERSQTTIAPLFGTTRNPVWVRELDEMRFQGLTDPPYETRCKFDVCHSADLTIYVYLAHPNALFSIRDQDKLLGVARVAVDLSRTSGELVSQWLDLHQGTGRLRISLKFEAVANRALGAADFDVSVGTTRKKDTRRLYASKVIPIVEPPQPLRHVDHPFIAPLSFTFQSAQNLHLFSPKISGGHLFNHLQRQRCFSVDRARFYAAEILCALEYLHDRCDLYAWMKPQNVLLDRVGHVVLCGFDHFIAGLNYGEDAGRGMPEYPAPEILLGRPPSKAADWWTLGIFLYEMMTGLPLFYREDIDKMRENILKPEAVEISELLPPAARDIITRLLDRDPDERLGMRGGPAEIKSHQFFAGMDWDKLLDRRYQPTFKPYPGDDVFEPHGLSQSAKSTSDSSPLGFISLYTDPEPESDLTSEIDQGDSNPAIQASDEAPVEAPVSGAKEKGDHHNDGWEIIWEEAAPGLLYFYNRSTGVKRLVPPRQEKSSNRKGLDNSDGNANLTGPSQSQKLDALEEALQAGHDHAASQLVQHYGVDLNARLFGYQFISPLEWAVDHENVGLVRLFLDNGADADLDKCGNRVWGRGGPALVRAVGTGNREIIELVVRRTWRRVSLTQALGLAVERRDVGLAQLLLSHGARCDFEVGDRPPPMMTGHPNALTDDNLDSLEEHEEFMPPLVRAVKLGDVGMVRLLLAHGADANIGYHDLLDDTSKPIQFTCGRVIEFAMEWERDKAVKLLLAAGADLGLGQPVWRAGGHRCMKPSRSVYQSVLSKLRAAAAEQTPTQSN